MDEINAWATARGLAGTTRRTLPHAGFIVPGVAVGFLFRTEADIGMLDSFITNPVASPEERHDALTLIEDALIESARERQIHRLIMLTQDDGLRSRAPLHGFRRMGEYSVFGKEI